jgi:hypothetical protein
VTTGTFANEDTKALRGRRWWLMWIAGIAVACAACGATAPPSVPSFITPHPPGAQSTSTLPTPASSPSSPASTPNSSSSDSSASMPTPLPPGEVADLLARIPVMPTLPNVAGYERSCSPGKGCVFGPAWTDVERTGCDTRNRVLASQLHRVVFKPGTRDCKVIAGVLDDPYSGTTIDFSSADPRAIEIDHVFALGRAWDAGAATWPSEKRVEFANDTDNLLAVSGALNGSKSDAGPGTWLPPNGNFACPFAKIYLRVAAKYQLAISNDDRAAAVSVCT